MKPSTNLPRSCTFHEQEWGVLARFWHPVALGTEVQAKPIQVTLLDETLVVYRIRNRVLAARDVCLHRGARLSLGWLEGDNLVCGFHGFHYDSSGACVQIPAHPHQPIPKKLCLKLHPTVERYGLVWVCLGGEPAAPLPDWPEMENGSLKQVALPPIDWNASAGRQIENFNDLAHLSWVHTGTFGHRDNPLVERYQVEDHGHRLTAIIARMTMEDRFLHADAPGKVSEVGMRYDCDLPFASRIIVDYGNGRHAYVFNVACPVSSRKTRIFEFYVHDFPEDLPKQFFIDYNVKALEEDQPFVESQCPEDLPLDIHAEVHIPADRLSVEYRKKLAALGLGSSFVA
jgi:phenylpropionate dioxygenase-like ring-hydroxylating dioxygenase large terminal subunit